MKKGFYAVLAGFAISFMALTGCDNLNNLSQNPTNTTEYIVRFDKNTTDTRGTGDANPKNKKVIPPAKYVDKLPTDPWWQDHVFMGWYTSPNTDPKKDSEFTETTEVTDSITVYARWDDYDKDICLVIFNGNGIEIDGDRRVKIHTDSTFLLDAKTFPPEPDRSGYYFMGWYTKQKGGDPFTINTVVKDDITVYAQWDQIKAGYYLINFNRNTSIRGSTDASPSMKQIKPNTAIGTLPSPPAQPLIPGQPGWLWESWNRQRNGSGDTILATTIIREDWFTQEELTVYAQWTQTNTVTFYKNDGTTELNPQILMISPGSDKIDKNKFPADPTRAGYTFGGWFTAKTEGDLFTSDDEVNKSMIVYARWYGQSYIVTFNKNGGTTDASPPMVQGSDNGTQLPAPPTRTGGYTFAGWNTKADGTGTAFTGSTPVTAPITVYAQWTPPSLGAIVTVTWDKLSNITANTTVTQGTPLTITVASTDTAAFSSWKWYVDDKYISTQTGSTFTYTINDAGDHIVTLLAEKGGKVYSAEIKITVTPPVPGGG